MEQRPVGAVLQQHVDVVAVLEVRVERDDVRMPQRLMDADLPVDFLHVRALPHRAARYQLERELLSVTCGQVAVGESSLKWQN